MAVKTGSQSATNRASFTTGVVLEVDENLVVLVRLKSGEHKRLRADILPGKSAPPLPGETWVLDQRFGSGWQLASPYAWTADLDWQKPLVGGGWSDVGAPNLAVGYRKEPEGWVALCGKLSGGASGSVAFTLPEGYRPGGTWTQLVPAGTGSGQLTVATNGLVTPQTATSPVSLDGVRFMAAG